MSQNDASNWDTDYEWKIILLLALTFGLVGLDRFILPVILQSPSSTMAADLGLTPQDGGTLAGYLGMAWGVGVQKTGLNLLGYEGTVPRLPNLPLSEAQTSEVREALIEAGIMNSDGTPAPQI